MENRKNIWLKSDTEILLAKIGKLRAIKTMESNIALMYAERHATTKTISKIIVKQNRLLKTLEAIESFFLTPKIQLK